MTKQGLGFSVMGLEFIVGLRVRLGFRDSGLGFKGCGVVGLWGCVSYN